MSAVDLLFQYPRTALPAQLLFGRRGGGETDTTTEPPAEAEAQLFISATVTHNAQTARASNCTAPHKQQQTRAASATATHGLQQARAASVSVRHSINDTATLHTMTNTCWQDALHIGHRTTLHSSQLSIMLYTMTNTRWQDAPQQRSGSHTHWQDCLRPIATLSQNWQDAQWTARTLIAISGGALPTHLHSSTSWQDALRAWGGSYTPPPPLPPQPCWQPNANGYVPLLFIDAYSNQLPAQLVFRCAGKGGRDGGATLYFSPLKWYLTVTDCFAKLSDGRDIEVLSCSISADVGSYGWTLDLTTTGYWFDELRKVNSPRYLSVWMQGDEWVFLIGSLGFQKSFPKKRTSIKGISKTATLGSRYAQNKVIEQNLARNAQQIAHKILEHTGFNLYWGLTDWLIPSGTLVLNGSPLSLLQEMAESVGGYINSDKKNSVIKLESLYGVPPWGWSDRTVDISIPRNFVIADSFLEEKRAIKNSIYVMGEKNGVLREIKRRGTAGDKSAAPVVDKYITATEPARQRGVAELAKYGHWNMVDMTMPVLPLSQKFINPGDFVEIQELEPWRGIVSGVRITYNRPKIRQQIRIEQYVE